MTDISNDKAAGLAAFELVNALISRLTQPLEPGKCVSQSEILLAVEDAIAQLEMPEGAVQASETEMSAAKLIRARYPGPHASTA